MNCPKCGYRPPWQQQAGWWIGLGGAVAIALYGQAEMIAEPWRHYVSIAAIVATAATAYMLKP